jgi:hypothetical protein
MLRTAQLYLLIVSIVGVDILFILHVGVKLVSLATVSTIAGQISAP